MHPDDRPLQFVPRKYKSLRHVPMYADFIKERFNRCLDLYLCPRAIKRKLQVDPDTLLPKLPDPKDLRPFPTTIAVQVRARACVLSWAALLPAAPVATAGMS
jgi:ribosome biogenesis protein ERB1